MIFLSLQNYSISPKYSHQYPKKCRSCPKLAYIPSFFPLFSTKSPFSFLFSFIFLISSFRHLFSFSHLFFPSSLFFFSYLLSVISFLLFPSSLFFSFSHLFLSFFSFSLLSVFHILAFAVLSLFFYCKMRWCLLCHCSKRFRRFATSRVLPALSPFKNTLFSAISPSQTSQNRIKSLSLPQKRKVLCD